VHSSGVKVALYGYANVLYDQIDISNFPTIAMSSVPVGGATLADSLLDAMPTAQISADIDPNINMIPVDDTANFPERGYLVIGQEVVYYNGYNDSRTAFAHVQRGKLNTTPAQHFQGEVLSLFSIRVTSSTQNYPSPVLIQIDDEWMGPLQKGEEPDIFTGVVNDSGQPAFTRAFNGNSAGHNIGAKVIPVLVATRPYTGQGDVVTIIEADQVTNPKEEKVVRNAMVSDGNNLFAFDDFVARSYAVDGVTRLLKFPSDELASYLPSSIYIGRSHPGDGSSPSSAPTAALIDELKFFRIEKDPLVLSGTMSAYSQEMEITLLPMITGPTPTVSADQQYIRMSPGNAPESVLAVNAGMIKMGDEIIGYADATFNENTWQIDLSGCKRGYLNSQMQAHDPLERTFYLPFMPMAKLTQSLRSTDYMVPLSTFNGFSGDAAYALVGNDIASAEMVGYCWQNGMTKSLQMPYDERKRGLFRGAFGTQPNGFPQDTLVYGMPFRYGDLQKPEAFDNQMANFQAAHSARGATWKQIRWEERHEPAKPTR
ncbi:MAG: hypothetical protein HY762_08530, partial [Planctomycetes bacterium]|nr:hypothetical protein [Planctomycetota bacterium]